jgi:hypothetical protein
MTYFDIPAQVGIQFDLYDFQNYTFNIKFASYARNDYNTDKRW